MDTIFSCAFSLHPQSGGEYALNVQFAGVEEPISAKKILFAPHIAPKKGNTLDLYSLNGDVSNNPFSKSDLQDIKHALQVIDFPYTQTLMVLDLKDHQGKYLGDSESLRLDSKV